MRTRTQPAFPLAHIDLFLSDSHALRCHGVATRAEGRSRRPEVRHAVVAQDTPDSPLVSVIIPVRDDSVRLESCLEALARQENPGAAYEVLVIDNGSKDDPGSVVAQFPGVRMLSEPHPGADRARNVGIRAARGAVLAFTDSDCIPHPDWIRCGVEALARLTTPGLVAGRIEVTARHPEAPTLAELHDLVLAFQQERCVRRSHYGATANILTRREVFEAVGPFREDYGGDAEWGLRVYRSGRPVVYADDVRVAHPARDTLADLVARTRRGARELVEWRRGSPLLFTRDQLKDLVPPPDSVWKILTSPVLRSWSARAGVFVLFLGLRQVRFWERLRLLLGGAPLR